MRSKDIYQEIRHKIVARTDHLFAVLMFIQWIGCVLLTWHLGRNWGARALDFNSALSLTVGPGGILTFAAFYLAKFHPGTPLTRHLMAVSQMLVSGFFIYVTANDVGSHFHTFGSLAFLAFYRDPAVIVTASLTAIGTALLRHFHVPPVGIETLASAEVNWIEFSCWVLFEDSFLIYSCIQSRREEQSIALHQSELESFAMKVEKEVQHRTAELKEVNAFLRAERARSIESQKMASLGEMASNIAHEINNPLAAIELTAMELVETCREFPINADACIALSGDIGSSVIRIGKIVQSLKAFAREDQQEPLRSASVEEIVSNTLVLCGPKFSQHGVQLRVSAPDHLVLVKCRPTQITQVLMNLLMNALDAVEDQADPWVELAWNDGYATTITITDSGTGVPAELREKIFHPFFTTKAVGKGTGIGLNLSKKIMDRHNGKIICSPIPGLSKFTIEFAEENHEHQTALSHSNR